MFSKLHNECILEFNMETESPLFIKSGEENPLNPTATDSSYLALYKDGKFVPVIPGTSLKGIFRSRAESILVGMNLYVCKIISNIKESCGSKIKANLYDKKKSDGKEKYDKSCSVCKIFGSNILKSRIEFEDAYSEDDWIIGKRKSVAIDRISGAAIGGAFYDFEYVEYGNFKCRIKLKNFFNWHIKLIIMVLQDINEGFVTFGGCTSKGFGRMKVSNLKAKVRYYNKKSKGEYEDKGFYIQRIFEEDEIGKVIKNIKINENIIKGCDIENEHVL
ncbi:CRISPR-associated protein, Csx7 family [Clostridium cochlearium]|uniref:CRISPR-associated protein, Csx7 family n=1 Tax=Clostridium cochlearium TaxID=1494 RepID=A0ABY0QP37_CLOCO|nr:CRISPR-associated RAMP protein Csx7 [Clostridium cochlearium]SDL41916.1 CRISPR-associated protein, Csx7 family [Clostridium cochlearium]